MARRTKEQEQAPVAGSNRVYERYENDDAWMVLNDAVAALVQNGDIKESTTRHHIVGFLCKCLADAGISTNTDHVPRPSESLSRSKPRIKVPR